MDVAVVGSGVAGLAAAHTLAKSGFRVTVLEADSHVGGHAHTMVVDGTPVDVGFMVFNGVTYPNMARADTECGGDLAHLLSRGTPSEAGKEASLTF